jgi:hypothetical protein
MQRQKTDHTLFLEYNLLKNRLLTLYKALENQVVSDKTSGTEKAKCAEVAANICIDVLKIESEGIKAVKEGLLLAEKAAGASRTSLSSSTSTTTSSAAISDSSRDMMMDDLEESC